MVRDKADRHIWFADHERAIPHLIPSPCVPGRAHADGHTHQAGRNGPTRAPAGRAVWATLACYAKGQPWATLIIGRKPLRNINTLRILYDKMFIMRKPSFTMESSTTQAWSWGAAPRHVRSKQCGRSRRAPGDAGPWTGRHGDTRGVRSGGRRALPNKDPEGSSHPRGLAVLRSWPGEGQPARASPGWPWRR
jgi:hypothetical protein